PATPARARRARPLDPRQQGEQQQEPVPHHPLVVGHQHPDRPAIPGSGHQDDRSFAPEETAPGESGNRSRTVNPPSDGPALSFPPCREARSAMLVRPKPLGTSPAPVPSPPRSTTHTPTLSPPHLTPTPPPPP